MKLVRPGGPVLFFKFNPNLGFSLPLCCCRFEPHPEDRQWLRLFYTGESKKKIILLWGYVWAQTWRTGSISTTTVINLIQRSLAVYLILFAVTCLFQTDINRGASQLLVRHPPHSAGAFDWDVWFSVAVSAGTTSVSVTAMFSLYVNYLRSPGWKKKASLSLTWQCLV